MFSYISSFFSSIKDLWNRFETWVAGWMPGFKTNIVTGLGAVGSAAALGQEYLTGLPTTTFMTATQMSIATLVLFTLAFWLRGIGTRTKPSVSISNPAS